MRLFFFTAEIEFVFKNTWQHVLVRPCTLSWFSTAMLSWLLYLGVHGFKYAYLTVTTSLLSHPTITITTAMYSNRPLAKPNRCCIRIKISNCLCQLVETGRTCHVLMQQFSLDMLMGIQRTVSI